jgi:hypothetical protein
MALDPSMLKFLQFIGIRDKGLILVGEEASSSALPAMIVVSSI